MGAEWKRKQTQVVWADLQAWVEQLHKEHGCRVRVSVYLPVPYDGIKPGVVCEAYRVTSSPGEEQVDRYWTVLDSTVSGQAEQYALRWVSTLLLRLENEAEERSAALPLPF